MKPATYTLSESDLIAIDLHVHHTEAAGGSLLMSRDGIKRHAQMIPKSLMREHARVAVIATRINGETSHKGRFHIVRWKLKQFGWLVSEDEGQGSLNLAHGKSPSEQGGSSA